MSNSSWAVVPALISFRSSSFVTVLVVMPHKRLSKVALDVCVLHPRTAQLVHRVFATKVTLGPPAAHARSGRLSSQDDSASP